MAIELATIFIGKELLVESTRKLINGISDINSHNDYYVNMELEDLDIYTCVKIIHSIMNFIEEKENNEMIKICIDELHKIVDKIDKELSIIKDLILLHKEKWFNSIRTPDYYNNVENVKKYKKILDKRLELFMNVFKMNLTT